MNPLCLIENTPELETERLILRRFKDDDISDLFFLLSDKEVNTFLPWFPVATLEETRDFMVRNYFDYYKLPSAYRYAVCLKTNQKAIGYVVLGNGESHDFGYGLRKEFWSQGIVAEAASAVLQRLKYAGCDFITATHDIHNPRSGAIMKKLGMTYRYSYTEQWQPKNIAVTFRMYQLNFNMGDDSVYMEYWKQYPEHFIENTV